VLSAWTGLDWASTLGAAGETPAVRAVPLELRAPLPLTEPSFIALANDIDDDLDDDDDEVSDCDWAFLEIASVHAADLLSFLVESTASRVLDVQASAFATTFPSLLDALGILLI
jgi:hypothetical protein